MQVHQLIDLHSTWKLQSQDLNHVLQILIIKASLHPNLFPEYSMPKASLMILTGLIILNIQSFFVMSLSSIPAGQLNHL